MYQNSTSIPRLKCDLQGVGHIDVSSTSKKPSGGRVKGESSLRNYRAIQPGQISEGFTIQPSKAERWIRETATYQMCCHHYYYYFYDDYYFEEWTHRKFPSKEILLKIVPIT